MKNAGILLAMAMLLIVMGISVPVLALIGIGLLVAGRWVLGALFIMLTLSLFWIFEYLREKRRKYLEFKE